MNKINVIKDQMVSLTRAVRQLEESMPMCAAFGSEAQTAGFPYRYKSATLQTSYNHLRDARMIMGDILRVIGVENPYTHAYTGVLDPQKPKYMEGKGIIPISWEDVIANGMGDNKSHESVCLGFVKTTLGDGRTRTGYLYQFNRLKYKMLYPANQPNDVRSEQWYELQSYCQMVFKSLKLANCYLGLRFGEIVTAPASGLPAEKESKVEDPKPEVIVDEVAITKETAEEAPVLEENVTNAPDKLVE